jgi:predicted amidohydrolase/ribosomal protein S18 acetylase RimI-like enzyme
MGETEPEKGNSMTKIDMKDFEKRVRLRKLRTGDYDAVTALQERCFPGMKTWSRQQFESQLRTFPEGQLCIEYDKNLVASSSSLIVDFRRYTQWHNWNEMSDAGFIRNHDPEGDTLYGIEIMVDPAMRGQRLSRRLYDARKKICRQHSLARIIIGGRIPGYSKHAPKLSAAKYVERVQDKSLFDPVLTPQVANGFVLKGLIPDYLPSDNESCGYATFLEWVNLDYKPKGTRHSAIVAQVRLCVVQYQMRSIKSFAEFKQQCSYFIDVASDYKSDFILFPELLTTQLLSCIKADRPGLAARKLAEFTPQYLDLFSKLAVKYNINIVGGSQFVTEEDKLYNISYLFRRNGTVGKQYKIHITPAERRWWGVVPGDSVEVFETDRGKIAIFVCYDVEFPELCRIAAAKGAEIFFVPFNTDQRDGYLRVRYCAQARCIENHVFVAIAGCTGNLPFVDNADIHYAQSGIFSPSDVEFSRDGIAAECTPNIETMIIHDVDTELLRRHRIKGSVQNWNDRRRDLYQVQYRENGKPRSV